MLFSCATWDKPKGASEVALISQEMFKSLALFPAPIVVGTCIFSHQAPVSQDFVLLLLPVSDLELHPCQDPKHKPKIISVALLAILSNV